ncbi:MAG TPA: phosphotransferase [Candidatus Saccharimonas sp.]|nr:phosphotransferase [Candidatus Saccharimonas sp.]
MSNPQDIFTPDQLVQLELDLIAILRAQGMLIEEIKLIGLKGAGDSSTVFAVLIDDVHHVLKVYRSKEAYTREIKHLRRQIPHDRFLFVWPARKNRFNYSIVVIEVPDGLQMHERMLTPLVAEQLGDTLITLHSLQYKKHVTVPEITRYFEEARSWATKHGELFPELGRARVAAAIDSGIAYTHRHAKQLRVPKSRTHNDLWWANVIVAEEDVYLIDWENLGRDDYCKDLAFFRIMTNYERTAAPVSMWDEDVDNNLIDTFMDPILERYENTFEDEFFWQRYGLYALQQASLNFARAVYGDRRGARRAGNIMLTGIRLFEDHCLATDS